MSWLKKGDEITKSEFLSSGSQKNTREFWLKEGKDNARKILFLDDPGIGFARHGLKIGENFEQLTCLDSECPLCAKGYYKSPCIVFSILDLTPYTDKDGKEKKYSRKTLLVKGKSMIDVLSVRRDNNNGTLAGLKMSVMRTEQKAPASGDDYEVIGRVDLSKLPVDSKDDLKPFNYEELFAPLSVGQIEAKIKYAAPPSSKFKKKTSSRSDIASSDGFATSAEPSFDVEESMPF